MADAERMLAVADRSPVTAQLPHVVRRVVAGLPAAREIAQYAASHGVDLIVVGTHGYGPVRRLVLGSVADRVIRTGAVPGADRAAPHASCHAAPPGCRPRNRR